jgi:hypothetical protein
MPPLMSAGYRLSQMCSMGMRVGAAVVGMVGDAIISGAQVGDQPLGTELDIRALELHAGFASALLAYAVDADGAWAVLMLSLIHI